MNFYMKSGDMSPVVTLKSPVVTCHLVTCQELFINFIVNVSTTLSHNLENKTYFITICINMYLPLLGH